MIFDYLYNNYIIAGFVGHGIEERCQMDAKSTDRTVQFEMKYHQKSMFLEL